MKKPPFVSKSLDNTARFAQQMADAVREAVTSTSSISTIPNTATILALSGDLGSGKTAFVKAFASALGITDTITSPTFVIEQIYLLPKTNSATTAFDRLIHIDAYRLEKASELERLGWAEIAANPRNIICLEWPENVAGLSGLSGSGDLNESSEVASKTARLHRLTFRFVDENTREISAA